MSTKQALPLPGKLPVTAMAQFWAKCSTTAVSLNLTDFLMGKLRFREVSNSPQVTHEYVKNKEDYNSDLLLLVFCTLP